VETEAVREILAAAPVFLLLAVRALGMIETAPLLSSEAVPQTAKIALAGFAAYTAFPTALGAFPPLDEASLFNVHFLLLIIGEGVIGVITGFFMSLVFAAFSTAGQFFSLQMGFGASETYDPLSQVENPLMGQYLNLVAMLVFLSIGGLQELFLGGFWRSAQSLNILSLVAGREALGKMLFSGLGRLFLDAIIIAMPILATLFLTSLSTGLISKAAPQINLLSEGFPISITVAFILIAVTMPFMIQAFMRVIEAGFQSFAALYTRIGAQIGAPP
jgi:flagellar biosynthetic protein FliR